MPGAETVLPLDFSAFGVDGAENAVHATDENISTAPGETRIVDHRAGVGRPENIPAVGVGAEDFSLVAERAINLAVLVDRAGVSHLFPIDAPRFRAIGDSQSVKNSVVGADENFVAADA